MRDKATNIVKRLQASGHEAVFAGGCVRDMLLGHDPKDYDIATSATPDEVESLFEKTIPVGKSFGVVVVVVDGEHFEVATFRNDGQYSDGRRPDSVSFSSMREDAVRRDFTVNALFYDPSTDRVIDFVGGRRDLANKVLRFVGNPAERIAEDNLRIMRLVRFAVRFGFEIDCESANAVRENAGLISNVSRERVAQELFKMLALKRSRRVVETLREFGLLNHILPEVSSLQWVDQPRKYHPEGDVWVHTMNVIDVLDGENVPTEIILAGLLHDIGKPSTQTFADRIRFNGHARVGAKMAEDVCRRLKLSNDQIAMVTFLVRNHMKALVASKMRKSRLKALMAETHFPYLLVLNKADSLGSDGDLGDFDWLSSEYAKFEAEGKLPSPLITGRDLFDLGLQQGPVFGAILSAVRDDQLNGLISTRDEALALALEMFPKA